MNINRGIRWFSAYLPYHVAQRNALVVGVLDDMGEPLRQLTVGLLLLLRTLVGAKVLLLLAGALVFVAIDVRHVYEL